MNEKRYETPEAFTQALTSAAKRQAADEAQARNLSPRDAKSYLERRVNQLRRDAAVHGILVRLGSGAPGSWVVKGGVALQLRLDPSRPSLDIDVAWMGEHREHEVAVRELRLALSRSTSDFFRYELDPAPVVDPDGSLVLAVTAWIGVRRFERFSIDIAPPSPDFPNEMLGAVPPPLGLAQLGIARVHVTAPEAQIADKVCAIHERHNGRHSSRWRDLADIAMLAQQVPWMDADILKRLISEEAARRPVRLAGALPKSLSPPTSQLAEWRRAWGTGGRDVPITLDEALDGATRFLNPVLDGTAEGAWDCGTRRWQ